MNLVYDRIELLLNTHSDNSESQEIESTIHSVAEDIKEESEPVIVVEEMIGL
jgi:hypothetical protein